MKITKIEGTTVITWLTFAALITGLLLALAGAAYSLETSDADLAAMRHVVRWVNENLPDQNGAEMFDAIDDHSHALWPSLRRINPEAADLLAQCSTKWDHGESLQAVSECILDTTNEVDRKNIESHDDTIEKIRVRCRSEWSGDYRMQKYCFDKQIEALHDIRDWIYQHWPNLDSISAAEVMKRDVDRATIISRCDDEWKGDYVMEWYCITTQEASMIKMRDGT